MKNVKYKIFTDANNNVIAVSTYAGRTVKGIAKCDPRDTFDLETGKQIAEARCAEKIAKKRLARAKKKYAEAVLAYQNAKEYMNKMSDYLYDSNEEVKATKKALENVLSEN